MSNEAAFQDNNEINSAVRRCLIIEDNTLAAEIMTIFFKKNGIISEIAENGEIGLKMYLDDPTKYDVIFLDLQMPVMDGYEVKKRIEENNFLTGNFTPIIVMSGTYFVNDTESCGFKYFLKKPFDLEVVPGLIDEVIEGNRH